MSIQFLGPESGASKISNLTGDHGDCLANGASINQLVYKGLTIYDIYGCNGYSFNVVFGCVWLTI